MSSQEVSTEDSVDSLSEVSSLDDDFAKMHFTSASSDEEVTDNEVDSNVWSEIKSGSGGECLKDYGVVQSVTPTSEDSTINPIDCYRHFITDEIISLMVREINRYAEQCLLTHKPSKRPKDLQWEPTTNEDMLKFWGIVIETGLIQMTITGAKVNRMDQKLFKKQWRGINLNYFSSFFIFQAMRNCIRSKTD